MRIAADARHTGESEVEVDGLEASFGKIGHEKGAEAAVDVEGYLVADREPGEGGNVVDDAVGEIGGRTDEENGVAVDKTANGGSGRAVGRRGTRDEVNFDAEVLASFDKRSVGGLGDDPASNYCLLSR